MTPAAQIFLTLVPLLIYYQALENEFIDEKAFLKEKNAEEMFEFIVVGGGTAGCVVARRLAEAKFKVLLLEAGGTPPKITDVALAEPGLIGSFTDETTFSYKTVKQEYVDQSNDGIVSVQASKMLGGGSSHNGMIYQRGSRFVYDGWANTTDDASWKYENMVQYFRKMENYVGSYTNSGQHGTGGPLRITSPYFPPSNTWIQAGIELGYTIGDPSGDLGVGFYRPSTFTKEGFRESSYSGYIKPVEESLKKYLTIRRYSPAHRIIFKGKKAVGVEYKRHGVTKMAKASKEIILSAGVFISPIILIKSGVGPREELKAAKVTTVMELPEVGKNLQDHARVEISPFHIKNKSQRWSIEGDMTFQELKDSWFRGNSYLGNPTVTAAYYTSTIGQKENPDFPDIQLEYVYQTKEYDTNACSVGFVRPRSRGVLKVNNSVTSMLSNDLPILNYRYLSKPAEGKILLEGIKFCLKIMENTTAFNKIGTSFAGKPIRGCRDVEFRSDDYWRCVIRQEASTQWHSVGTCRMGKKGDVDNSVVDSKLRVQGVKNLRVIDASVMPTITSANTCGPTYAISEKGVAGILADYS